MRVGPGHAAALAAIHAASFGGSEVWTEAAFAQLLASPGVWGLAREAGFILLRLAADEAEVVTFAVMPAARRQGVGSALLTEAIVAARAASVRRLFLEVAEGNAAARALYAKAGFAQVGTRRRYYPGGADAVVMALALG